MLKYKPLTLAKIFAVIFLVTQAIAADLEDVNGSDNKLLGVNALMLAAGNNDVEGVKFFIKSDNSLINKKNFGGATALHMAARSGNFEIVEALVKNGAKIDVSDNEGWTPLMRAALAGNKEIVTFLINNEADLSKLNSVGESAIIQAANSKCVQCLSAMFDNFDFANKMDEKLLKQQLSDAFVIAQNREDKVMQDLLRTYLDSLTNPVESATTNAQDIDLQRATVATLQPNSANSGKKFKLVEEVLTPIAKPVEASKDKEEIQMVEPKQKQGTKNDSGARYVYSPIKDESANSANKEQRDIEKVIFSLKEVSGENKSNIVSSTQAGGKIFKFKKLEDEANTLSPISKPFKRIEKKKVAKKAPTKKVQPVKEFTSLPVNPKTIETIAPVLTPSAPIKKEAAVNIIESSKHVEVKAEPKPIASPAPEVLPNLQPTKSTILPDAKVAAKPEPAATNFQANDIASVASINEKKPKPKFVIGVLKE